MALGEQAVADLRATTSASVRPTSRPGRDLGDDPVGGLRGQAQQLDLVGVLDHPQLAQHGRGDPHVGAVEARVAPDRRPGSPAGGSPTACPRRRRWRRRPWPRHRAADDRRVGVGPLVERQDLHAARRRRPRRRHARGGARRSPRRATTGRASSGARGASPGSRSGSADPGRRRPAARRARARAVAAAARSRRSA